MERFGSIVGGLLPPPPPAPALWVWGGLILRFCRLILRLCRLLSIHKE